jgi:hypothetical protein
MQNMPSRVPTRVAAESQCSAEGGGLTLGALAISDGQGGYINLAPNDDSPVQAFDRQRRLGAAGINLNVFPRISDGGYETLVVAEGETLDEARARIAALKDSRRRQAERFRCPDCGEPGAMTPPNDRFHIEDCPGRSA